MYGDNWESWGCVVKRLLPYISQKSEPQVLGKGNYDRT
jgi:hypothetical protein